MDKEIHYFDNGKKTPVEVMSGMRPGSFFSRSGNSTRENNRSHSSVGSNNRDETPLRRREAVTVSTSELNKLFDGYNSISLQLRENRKLLQNLETTQDVIVVEVRHLREENKLLHEKLENMVEDNSEDESRIPPEISNDVHLLHNALETEERYKPDESILSPHNTSVRQGLQDQLVKNENGYPLRFVKRAIVRYYETKRKLYLQSLPENQEKATQLKADNKLRSRRKRLYKARAKTAEGEDRDKLNALSYEYVSDEENGSGDNRGKWVVRPPVWRSLVASELMRRLQDKVEASQEDRPRNPRVPGTPSQRSKPRMLVAWAVGQSIREGTPEPQISGSPLREQSPERSRSPSPISSEGERSRSPSPQQSKKRGRTASRRITRSLSRSPAKNVAARGRSKFHKRH